MTHDDTIGQDGTRKIVVVTHGSFQDYVIDVFNRHPEFGTIACFAAWKVVNSLSYRNIPVELLSGLDRVDYDAILVVLKDFNAIMNILPRVLLYRKNEQTDVFLVNQLCVDTQADFIVGGNFDASYVQKLPASSEALDIAAEMFPLKRKLEKIIIQVEVAAHCNLNCRGCNHFSPLSEPEFLDIEEFKRDMERLGDLFGHVCNTVNLMGGEPLLHPEVAVAMSIARENFTDGRVALYTNGILLPRMDEVFWRSCHDNDVEIQLTHYPIKIDIERIKALAEKFVVKVCWHGVTTETKTAEDSWMVRTLDVTGKMNSTKNFVRCSKPVRCIELLHGRFYPCDIAAHIYRFNQKFGTDIQVSDADSVDIYQENDAEAILQKLRRPLPFCRYCDLDGVYHVPWGLSEKKMSEWQRVG